MLRFILDPHSLFLKIPQADSWAVYIGDGSTLNMTNTCFIDNVFVGKGVVVAESSDGFRESNSSGTATEGLTCQFASVDDVCVPYSSNTCNSGSFSLKFGGSSLIVMGVYTFLQIVIRS
jgi:hypothetical protein